jgi:hypothetical protein
MTLNDGLFCYTIHSIYDNGVRVVNFTTSKNLTVRSALFPNHNIHKFSWTSPDGKTDRLAII